MNTTLLVIHVIGSILFIGPVTLATSLYPRFAPLAPPAITPAASTPAASTPPASTPTANTQASGAPAVAGLLHRVTRVYGVIGMAVPALGFALAARMGILGDPWVVASMILTALAAGLLACVIYPLQRSTMEGGTTPPQLLQLRVSAGTFALLWAIVVVLMIVRPGASS